MASPWHLLVLHLFEHPDIPCSCWWEEVLAIMAKNFRSLILKKILSHRRERRRISSQNTFGDCMHILQKASELTKNNKSRLSCSLGTSITSRTKILSRNASCAGVPQDVMTWQKSPAHNQGKFSWQRKVKHYTCSHKRRRNKGLELARVLSTFCGSSTTVLLGKTLSMGFQAQHWHKNGHTSKLEMQEVHLKLKLSAVLNTHYNKGTRDKAHFQILQSVRQTLGRTSRMPHAAQY